MTSDKPRARERAPAAQRRRRFATWPAIAYVVAVILVGFWGTPVDAAAGPMLARLIADAHGIGVPVQLDYSTIEFLANVVFFTPLGVLVVLIAGTRWWWVALAAGLVGSGVIEIGQALFLPARTASLADVLANVVGAALGAAASVWVLNRAARRRH